MDNIVVQEWRVLSKNWLAFLSTVVKCLTLLTFVVRYTVENTTI